jgi:hypothetical protein
MQVKICELLAACLNKALIFHALPPFVGLNCEPYSTIPSANAAGADQVLGCPLEGLLFRALFVRGADAAPIGLLAPLSDRYHTHMRRHMIGGRRFHTEVGEGLG